MRTSGGQGKGWTIVSVGGVDAARRVEEGEAFDIVVLAADAIDSLAPAAASTRAAGPTSLVRAWRSR